MAITVTTSTEDIWGSNRVVFGTITASDLTSASFDTGLTDVESIQVPHDTSAAVTVSGGTVTITPALAGVLHFVAIGN
jgi:hypothetical protein